MEELLTSDDDDDDDEDDSKSAIWCVILQMAVILRPTL